MSAFSKFSMVLMMGVAGVALGQGARPSLVAVPLDLDPNPSLTRFEEPLKEGFRSVLEQRSGTLLVSKKESQAAIKETKRQDFRESDEGLTRLAEKAGALYSLYASLEFTPRKTLVLTGRVVRDDGKLMKSTQVQLPKGADTIVELLKPLTIQFIEQLGLSTLPSFKEAAVVAPPPTKLVPDPIKLDPPPLPPPDPPLVAVDQGQGQRAAGRGLVIAGGGVAVVAAVLFGAGGLVGAGLNPAEGILPRSQAPAWRTANVLSTIGVVGLAAGGVTAAVGAIVWGIAPSAPTPVKVLVAPQAGGATFSLQGEF